MPHATGSARSARRVVPLVLALGIGLVSGCSAEDDATGAAATSSAPSSSAEASTSAAAPTSSSSSAPAEAEVRTVSVDEGEMFIRLSETSLPAGTYSFEITNSGRMPHDFVVEQGGSDLAATEVLQPGESATLEVELAPGDYVFYCSVGAHRAAGMELPVTVAT